MHIIIFKLNHLVLAVEGPFPTEDQAMTYAETQTHWTEVTYTVNRLITPRYIPEPIHD